MVGREREMQWWAEKGNAMVGREREMQWWVEKGKCNGG